MNYYEILNLPNDATYDEIKSSFKKLVLKYHPDKNNGKTTDVFKKIKLAYKTLSNPYKRGRYDEQLKNSFDNINLDSNFPFDNFPINNFPINNFPINNFPINNFPINDIINNSMNCSPNNQKQLFDSIFGPNGSFTNAFKQPFFQNNSNLQSKSYSSKTVKRKDKNGNIYTKKKTSIDDNGKKRDNYQEYYVDKNGKKHIVKNITNGNKKLKSII